MKNIAFIGNSEPPSRLLNLFRRQTPGGSGVWGELRGVDNYEEADYFGVIDYVPEKVKVDRTKCVLLGAHPETMRAYRDMSNAACLAKFDCKHTFGFGEWWIKYDYDYLAALEPMQKTKELACIMSDAESQPYHLSRKQYLQRACAKHGERIDVYGRIKPFGAIRDRYIGCCGSYDPRGAATSGGNDHMSGKEAVYEAYKYAIEFDAPGSYYFSERVFDCLLLWCMPIYWGCDHLQEFIDKGSFSRLDMGRDGDDAVDVVDSNVYEIALPYIRQARDTLLNELQLWPRIHNAIFGRCR
jgi:hypothetical protein